MKKVLTKKTKALMGIKSYEIKNKKDLEGAMYGFDLVSKDMLSLLNQLNKAAPQTLASFPDDVDTSAYAAAIEEYSKAAAVINRTITDMVEAFNGIMKQLPEKE